MFTYIYNAFMAVLAVFAIYLGIDCMILTQSALNAHKANIATRYDSNVSRAPAVISFNLKTK